MIIGVCLIALSVALIVAAKPKNGERRSFLRFDFLTELYALAIVTGLALGVTWIIDGFAAWAK